MIYVLAFIIALLDVAGWSFVLKFGVQWVNDTHAAMHRVTDIGSTTAFIVLPTVLVLASIVMPALYMRRRKPGTALGISVIFLLLLAGFVAWTFNKDYPVTAKPPTAAEATPAANETAPATETPPPEALSTSPEPAMTPIPTQPEP